MAVFTVGTYVVGDELNNPIDGTAIANLGAVGLDGHDRIFTANASAGNSFEGNRGADNIFFAGSASGSLYGGEGNDLVSGADGQDAMYGGEGDDWIDGNWQNNGADNDSLYGGAGRDALHGKGGNDLIYGGAGDDKGQIATASPTTWQDNQVNFTTDAGLYGGDGDDYLDGGAGDDFIDGGNGNDDAHGGSGADEIKGFAGADSLEGGGGSDSLFGGLGNDLLSGGAGADKFVFDSALSATANVDRVRDFSKSDGDSILLSATIFDEIGASLDKKEFRVGQKAKDGNDYIVFNQKKGTIAYDADGKGGEKAVVFATVEKGMKLAYTDFDIAA